MRSREPETEFTEETPQRLVVVFRGFVILLLLVFVTLLGFLIIRGQTSPGSPRPSARSANSSATATTTLGVEIPTLVVAHEAQQNLAVTPLPAGPNSSQMIEVVPVSKAGVVVSVALPTNLAGFEAKPLPTAPSGQPNPYFGPNFNPNDGKPIYVCAVDSFASYLVMMQMQTAGIDVQHGFHLGIVPYSINDKEYEIPQEKADAYLKKGEWDCDLGTMDTVARTGYGVVTAIIDESAGGDGIYARGINSIYELKGKRLGYVRDVSAELFARYVVQVAQLTTKTVSFVPFNDINEAVIAFDAGQIDAMSGWDPYLRDRAKTGGKPLVTSEQLRVILDVVVTSQASIQNKPQVVQSFHDAWFSTLKTQLENYDYAAALIAAWGHNDWLAISKENAAADLRAQMQTIAQADLQHNVRLMANLAPIYNQIAVARRVWAEAGPLAPINAQTLVNSQFVLASAAKPELQTAAKPLNNTFSLVSSANQATAGGNGQPIVATTLTTTQAGANTTTAQVALPCKRFTFQPDRADLSADSQNAVNLCVLTALQQRPSAFLKITGSAAWPGPAGTFSETQVLLFAQQRAQAMADYLAAQGIDRARLMVEGVLPPTDHRQTLDAAKQAEDRYVEMTLVTTGL
jgi:outer membrane protein OmpA-like peptidoglycan-associated protein